MYNKEQHPNYTYEVRTYNEEQHPNHKKQKISDECIQQCTRLLLMGKYVPTADVLCSRDT